MIERFARTAYPTTTTAPTDAVLGPPAAGPAPDLPPPR